MMAISSSNSWAAQTIPVVCIKAHEHPEYSMARSVSMSTDAPSILDDLDKNSAAIERHSDRTLTHQCTVNSVFVGRIFDSSAWRVHFDPNVSICSSSCIWLEIAPYRCAYDSMPFQLRSWNFLLAFFLMCSHIEQNGMLLAYYQRLIWSSSLLSIENSTIYNCLKTSICCSENDSRRRLEP